MLNDIRLLVIEEEAATYESLARMKRTLAKVEKLLNQVEMAENAEMAQGENNE